jgi:hypothetical protein
MTALRVAALVIPALGMLADAACAQGSAIYISQEEQTYADGFYGHPAGTVGLVTVRACSKHNSLTGHYVYLVKSGQIYWGTAADCVRVVVNHQNTSSDQPKPTYLGVQIIGLYDAPQPTSVILRRVGKFTDGQKPLPDFDDVELAPGQLSQDDFNRIHTTPNGPSADAALQELDRIVGARWHGTPDGGDQNSWDRRYWFGSSTAYDTRLSLRSKVLENRLIRFTPYPANGRPQNGPLSFDVNRKGAGAAVIRVFSPSNSDLDQNFALVYTTTADATAQVVTVQVAQASWLPWRW